MKSNDPISIIKNDHRNVESLFEHYEDLEESDLDERSATADAILSALEIHAEMEEELCYPRFKEILEGEDDKLVLEAEAEHGVVKMLIGELRSLTPSDEEFDPKLKVLKENVTHHVEEEENELLPKAEEEIDEDTLATMGEKMLAFKTAHGQEMEEEVEGGSLKE